VSGLQLTSMVERVVHFHSVLSHFCSCSGYPINAFQMWMTEGIVTGGDYGSTSTCQPYFLPPCEHHTVGPLPQCVPQDSTPSCSTSCTHGASYTEDKHYGSSAYRT
jgi:cathepsin B